MKDLTAQLVVDLECTPGDLNCLRDLSRSVESFHGLPPPPADSLAEVVSTIINYGTREEVGATFALLKGWSFKPQ